MASKTTKSKKEHRPELPEPNKWQKTLEAVHLWSQIIGKIRMAHTPKTNHSWHVTLYVSSCGLTTSLIPHPSGGFEIKFNFTDHKLELQKVNDPNVF